MVEVAFAACTKTADNPNPPKTVNGGAPSATEVGAKAPMTVKPEMPTQANSVVANVTAGRTTAFDVAYSRTISDPRYIMESIKYTGKNVINTGLQVVFKVEESLRKIGNAKYLFKGWEAIDTVRDIKNLYDVASPIYDNNLSNAIKEGYPLR